MPRKRSDPSRSTRPLDDRLRSSDGDWLAFPWLASTVAVLFTSRFFLPAESAAQGETLWIVLLWLLCGLGCLADAYRNKLPLRRVDWLDAGLLLLVGGHVVSAMHVLMTEGHKRAALNMLWEWVGMGVAGLLLRVVMREQAGRERLLSCIVISGVVLSGLGFWQHYVWYPRIAAQYGELDRLQSAMRADETQQSSSQHQRLRELHRELGVTPGGDETSARMLRDRIQASTEPIGRFALANTLAGLLVVAFLISLRSLGQLVHQKFDVRAVAVGLVVLGLLGYCLLLTKSRTAMVGLVCGLGVGLCLAGRLSFTSRWSRWAGLTVSLGVVGMVLAAVLSGSLDRQVITETPKSIRYRLEYWSATGNVIQEHPLLGVGPGNFRQNYLRHKLPESSEEILDPHNFVLDVWANGGLIALAGLVCLMAVTVQRCIRLFRQTTLRGDDVLVASSFNETVLYGAIGSLAMILAAIVEILQGMPLRSDWLLLAAGWWLTVILLSVVPRSVTHGKLLLLAVVGLFVHLTGAGGIAMPAILQILLAVIFAIDAVNIPSVERNTTIGSDPTRAQQSVRLTALIVSLGAVMACVTTAAIPVTMSMAAISIGRAAMAMDGNPTAAERAFRQAAEDDSLLPDPWQELALVRLERWRRQQHESVFVAAIEAQQEAIARDPANANRWRVLGQLWWQRFEKLGSQEDARKALTAYAEASARYPHLAAIQAEVARSAAASGGKIRSKAAARQALHLDGLNREYQHIDKFLSLAVLAELRSILGTEETSDRE